MQSDEIYNILLHCVNKMESFYLLQSDEIYNILLNCINIIESLYPLQSDEIYNILLHCVFFVFFYIFVKNKSYIDTP